MYLVQHQEVKMAVLFIGCDCDQIVSKTLHRFASGEDLPDGITGRFPASREFLVEKMASEKEVVAKGVVAKVHSTSHHDWPVKMLGLAVLETGYSAIDVPRLMEFTMIESVFVATVEPKYQRELIRSRPGIHKPGYSVFVAWHIPFVDLPHSLIITDAKALGTDPERTLIHAMVEHFVFPAEELPRVIRGGCNCHALRRAKTNTDLDLSI